MGSDWVRKPNWRRIGTAAIALLCVFVWAPSCLAAAFPRGYDPDAGYQYLELGTFPQRLEGGLEPILWRVLSADSHTVLLLSEYVLAHRRVHYDDVAYERGGGDFTMTEMYAYLNGGFLESFTPEERALLSAGEGGALVTLPSREDLSSKAYGFTGNPARRGLPTPYALQNGLFQYSNGSSPYWTRTQSTTEPYGAVCTKENGNLGYIRVVVQNEGCRPMIRLDAGLLAIKSGNGSMADPFRVKLPGGFETE